MICVEAEHVSLIQSSVNFCLPNHTTSMTSFLGCLPVSIEFDLSSQCCQISPPITCSLGHIGPATWFTQFVTAFFDGRLLTTDVELKIKSGLNSNILVGMNWIAVWQTVGQEDRIVVSNADGCSMSGS